MTAKYKIAFLFLFINMSLFSQTVKEVLDKVNKEYSDNRYFHFNVKYNLYKNAKSKKIHESYTGEFNKNPKNEIYQKIDKAEIIFNKEICLKVIHPDKVMQVSLSQPIATGEIDLKELLQMCKVKSFTDRKNYWELTLEAKPFSDLPYNKIVINIGKNYCIQKQLFYYNTGINFSGSYDKQKIEYPVLEILFTNFNRKKTEDKYFDTSRFLIVSKKGIKLSKGYSGYSIEDQREISFK